MGGCCGGGALTTHGGMGFLSTQVGPARLMSGEAVKRPQGFPRTRMELISRRDALNSFAESAKQLQGHSTMIKILSYGLGNIKAIANIYSRLNIPCGIASDKADLESATKVILPGVGAFDQAMKLLNESGMREPVDCLVREEGVPVLGICVGMQMMASQGDEGNAQGLGWIEGRVIELSTSSLSAKPKLPHMGWNSLRPTEQHRLFEGVDCDRGFYFLHSYHFVCADEENVLATSQYGEEFASAVSSGNIYGVQFHPEKSHHNGVSIFKNFAEI